MILSDAREAACGWEPPALAPRRAPAAGSPEQEAERLRREAYEAGYAEGLAAGRARAESIVGELSALLGALATPFRATDATLLRELVALVERTTRAVLGRELEAGAYDLEALLSEALAVLGTVTVPVELTLHPVDAALCREHALQLEGSVELREDSTLQRGGLRLRAGHRIVDASTERRLDEVLAKLRDGAGVPDPAAAPSAEDADRDGR